MSLTVNIYYTGKNGSARKFVREMIASGIVDEIRAENGNVRYTNIIWGMSIKPNLAEDEMEVVVVATGFNNDNFAKPIIIKNEEPEEIVELPKQPQNSEVVEV